MRGIWLAFAVAFAGCGPVDPDAELAAARERMAAAEYGEAAIRLSNVLQAQPENVEALRLRGELSLVQGEYAGAADELARAEALGAPRASVALGLAEAWTVLGEPGRALDLLESTEVALAGEPLYWILRAEALLATGSAEAALQALDGGAAAGDGGSRAQVVRVRAVFALGRTAEAEALLEAALRAAPDDARSLTMRAELYARTDRLDAAAADLLRAADVYRADVLDSREVAALLALVQVHLARNDLDSAETAAARLAERAPQAQMVAYFSGLVAFRRGDFDEAAAQIQPLVNVSPQNAQFRSLLGAVHLARGNLGQAEQQFLTVLAANPRDPAAVKLLAETRLRQQRPEAALDALRALQGAATDDPQIGMLSGVASFLAGDAEQGLLYLEQAASLDPANELLRLQLARAYLAAGLDAEASDLLRGSFESGAAPLEAGLLRFFADIRAGGPSAGDAAASALLAEFPDEPLALTAVAIHLQLEGQNERARELFERAAALETEGATARLFVAAALVQEGRREEAEDLLAEVLDTQPDNAQALTAQAQLLAARNELDGAAALLVRAAERSQSITPRLALAQLRMRQGNFDGARRELEIAGTVSPDNPELAAMRGLLALAEGRAGDAAALLRAAETALPSRLGIALALAQAELASGRPDVARTTLLRVLDVVPQSLPVRRALGRVELSLGNAEDALSIAAALKAEFPAQSAGYALEGEARIATRRYSSAVDSFAAAFEREPTWTMHARWLEALRLAGREAEALSVSAVWAGANPSHVPGTLMHAGLLQAAGRDREALQFYDHVLGIDQDNLVALNNAAWLAHELGEPRALELAEHAHGLAADNPAVLDTLGWILLAEGRGREALPYLSSAAELAPRALEIRYHLAQALATLGRSAEAQTVLTALLDEGREFEQRADAVRLLETL